MSAALRTISLTVAEPRPGRFVWKLLEAADPDAQADWAPLQQADQPAPSYREALAAGLVALKHLADDMDAGPRVPKQAEGHADPSGPARKGGFFGFGPVR